MGMPGEDGEVHTLAMGRGPEGAAGATANLEGRRRRYQPRRRQNLPAFLLQQRRYACLTEHGRPRDGERRITNHRVTETQRRKTQRETNSKKQSQLNCLYFFFSLSVSSLCLRDSVVSSFIGNRRSEYRSRAYKFPLRSRSKSPVPNIDNSLSPPPAGETGRCGKPGCFCR